MILDEYFEWFDFSGYLPEAIFFSILNSVWHYIIYKLLTLKINLEAIAAASSESEEITSDCSTLATADQEIDQISNKIESYVFEENYKDAEAENADQLTSHDHFIDFDKTSIYDLHNNDEIIDELNIEIGSRFSTLQLR